MIIGMKRYFSISPLRAKLVARKRSTSFLQFTRSFAVSMLARSCDRERPSWHAVINYYRVDKECRWDPPIAARVVIDRLIDSFPSVIPDIDARD